MDVCAVSSDNFRGTVDNGSVIHLGVHLYDGNRFSISMQNSGVRSDERDRPGAMIRECL